MKKTMLAAVIAMALLFASPALAANLKIDSVNYKPSPAEPGKTIDMFVTLTNDGSDAEAVIFELDLLNENRTSAFPFALTGNQEAKTSTGALKSGKSALIKYNILIDPKATSKDYALRFKFGEKGNFDKSTAYSITVSGKNPDIELVGSENNTGTPGETIDTSITIKNTGNSKAVDVLIGFEEDRTVTSTGVVVERSIRAFGVNFVYADELAPGEEKTIELPLSIDPSTEIKTYSVPITLKWQNEDAAEFSKTRNIGVKVAADPEIGGIISSVDPQAYPGGTSEIEVAVFNTGKGKASNIVVEVESGAVESFDQARQFIGTLESDDSDIVRVNAKIREGVELKEHDFILRVLYKEPHSDKTISSEIHLKLAVSNPPSNGGALGYAALIIMILGAGYWLWKKRKRGK